MELKTPAARARALSANDAELLAVVLIWAFNVTVVKVALREMDPLAFNLARFTCASAALLALLWSRERSFAVARRDLGRLLILAVVGHTIYQICFIEGVARTTASSVSLLFGSTPVVVGLLSHAAGHERIGARQAAGVLLAFLGVALIVRMGAAGPRSPAGAEEESAMLGNLLIVGAVVCWSLYTILARGMLQRYSPLRVTALSLSLGTVMLVPPSLPSFLRQRWSEVSGLAWAGLAYSFLFALVVAYVIWYRSVKKVGNVRTAVYSNLVPVFGTLFGVWLLGERLSGGLWLGATCVLAGILMTRSGWIPAHPRLDGRGR
jgi:drug/metabolite transporter (DMT)-like permease